MKFSFIIPVYNRPQEVEELLESMHKQSKKDFEVIIVEDGSNIKCDEIVEKYKNLLNIKYFFKNNTGPGQSRNYGSERVTGNYCIFLDSDCILPADYFEIVQNSLTKSFVDAYGGPDKADSSFTLLQKAINYSMTSFFTTGGIRGGSEKIDKFHPRSFNMGYSKEVFNLTKGFSKMRFGEDIDMSIRILDNGFKTKLLKEAYVYHKRRTNFRQFFKQIYNSGIARINLSKRHPKSLKLVHLAPAIFLFGLINLLILIFSVSVYFVIPIIAYTFMIFIDSWIKNKNLKVGLLSILTSYCQLTAYGLGFITAFWKRNILKGDEFSAFNKNFYK
ncbi:MAG: glycosyltransferase [Bacteroidales bacterium]|nr:glycosyltransferase [Bacteroidales bacterium]